MLSKLMIFAMLILPGFPIAVVANASATPTANETYEGMSYVRIYQQGTTHVVTVAADTFETNGEALAYLEDLEDFVANGLEQEMGSMNNLEITELEDFDADGFSATGRFQLRYVYMHMISFVDDNVVFSIVAMDMNETRASEMSVGISNFIFETKPNDSEVVLREDGTSTGGVYDRFPTTKDDAINGYSIVSDMGMPVTPLKEE